VAATFQDENARRAHLKNWLRGGEKGKNLADGRDHPDKRRKLGKKKSETFS